MAKQIFGHIPSAIHFTDNLVLGHLHIIEKCLTEWRAAGDQQDRLGRNAGAGHVEQQEADALIFVRLVGADKTENPVCLVGIARPDLLAIHDPVIALVLAERLQRNEIGTGAGFRISLAPANFPACDLGEIVKLLLLGSEFQQCRAEHPYAERHQRRPAAELCHFTTESLGFFCGKPPAAIGLGPVGHGPAPFRHDLKPLLLRRILELEISPAPASILVATNGLAHFRGAVRLQPGTRLRAESLKI